MVTLVKLTKPKQPNQTRGTKKPLSKVPPSPFSLTNYVSPPQKPNSDYGQRGSLLCGIGR